MSVEIQRNTLFMIIATSAAAGLLSFLVIQPNSLRADELEQTAALQSDQIRIGERQIQQDEHQVQAAISTMENVRTQFLEEFTAEDSTRSYQYLQRTALHHGLTVTRIEPMRTGTDAIDTGDPLERAILTTREFRIECVAPYSGLVEFFQVLRAGEYQAEIVSFKVVPASAENVRVSMQVKCVELSEFPAELGKSLIAHEPTTGSGTERGEQ